MITHRYALFCIVFMTCSLVFAKRAPILSPEIEELRKQANQNNRMGISEDSSSEDERISTGSYGSEETFSWGTLAALLYIQQNDSIPE